MIAIVNISPEGTPAIGVNRYQVRINKQVICEFDHYRNPEGLARCLRDAADAVDKHGNLQIQGLYSLVMNVEIKDEIK